MITHQQSYIFQFEIGIVRPRTSHICFVLTTRLSLGKGKRKTARSELLNTDVGCWCVIMKRRRLKDEIYFNSHLPSCCGQELPTSQSSSTRKKQGKRVHISSFIHIVCAVTMSYLSKFVEVSMIPYCFGQKFHEDSSTHPTESKTTIR